MQPMWCVFVCVYVCVCTKLGSTHHRRHPVRSVPPTKLGSTHHRRHQARSVPPRMKRPPRRDPPSLRPAALPVVDGNPIAIR